MQQDHPRANAPKPTSAELVTNLFAALFLLGVAGLAAFVTSQRVEQYRWEKAASTAFNERQSQVPNASQLFDHSAR
jgi:hypothetical protein